MAHSTCRVGLRRFSGPVVTFGYQSQLSLCHGRVRVRCTGMVHMTRGPSTDVTRKVDPEPVFYMDKLVRCLDKDVESSMGVRAELRVTVAGLL